MGPIILVVSGAIGLKLLVRQHVREELRTELAQQAGFDQSLIAGVGNPVDDRICDPANQDLLVEAYIEDPRLRPPAERYIRQAGLYRLLFKTGYKKLEPEGRPHLVALGLAWEEDLSGEIIDTLNRDYPKADPELRRQILLALASVDSQVSAQRLQEKFNGGSMAEKKLILDCLVRMHDPAATETLIALHKTGGQADRQEILNALARKATPAGLDYVCEVMTAGGDDLQAGYEALTRAGAPALSAAVRVSCHTDAAIRRRGAEATAAILKLAPRGLVLKLVLRPGDFAKKMKALEDLQARAPFCRRYQIYARGFRRIGGGEEHDYSPCLGQVTIGYARGILTVTHQKQEIVAEITGPRSFKLDLSAFRREGCEVKGRTGTFRIRQGRITCTIPDCVRSTETSEGTDSFTIVMYRVCGIEFK